MAQPTGLIAIVDDDAGVRAALRRLLRSVGFAVTSYESAEAFLARSGGDEPHCLLLDINLGGMSGFDLQHHLLRSGAGIPVIFITGQDEPAIREGVHQAGDVPCLRKPFEQGTLVDTIRRLTHHA